METVKLDSEAAKLEFDRVCESWKISIKHEEKDTIQEILTAFEDGRLVVHEPGEGLKLQVTHNLLEPITDDGNMNSITYRFLRVKDMMALDKFTEDENFGQMAAICKVFSRTNIENIKKMHPRDMMLGKSLGGLFLAN